MYVQWLFDRSGNRVDVACVMFYQGCTEETFRKVCTEKEWTIDNSHWLAGKDLTAALAMLHL